MRNQEEPKAPSIFDVFMALLGAALPYIVMLAACFMNSPMLMGLAIFTLISSKKSTGDMHFYMTDGMKKAASKIVNDHESK